MAPNRKKKKPASNPARGFTTVSIPSKPKATDSLDAPDAAANTVESEVPSDSGKSNQPETKQKDTQASQHAPGLESLTPAELERHLEEAELQSIIDKYALKCKNDAARQAVKLETERRVLRPQASPLGLRDWLPTEILDQILDMARRQAENLDLSPRRDPGGLKKLPSDEDICVKLWTLKQALLKLDIDESKLDGALRHALLYFPYASTNTSRDTVWSLEESLEWLAMYCAPGELPAYANNKPKLARVPDSVALLSSDASQYPSSSGSTTPSDNFYKKKEKNSKKSKALSSPVSDDSDDYFDPESLIPEYISLKSRIYREQPELFDIGKKQRRKKAPGSKAEEELSPEVAKLRRKVAKIEADVLFDRPEAEHAWKERLEGLRMEMVEEREHRVASKTNDSQETKEAIEDESKQPQKEKSAETMGDQDVIEENEESGLFGDIFSPEEEPLFDSVQNTEDNNSVSAIRDFGKWSGLSPRRVLEETCKARDSGCKVSYRVISSSSFSNRTAVDIKWSKSQDIPQPVPLSMISHKSNSRLTLISMTSISTPTVLQSEAYVSTVALFLLFAHSPKESKAHMRLPAIWRDLWTELSEAKKEHENRLDKEEFKGIQKLQQEMAQKFEDDVVLTSNFRKRNGNSDSTDTNTVDVRHKVDTQNSDRLIKLWTEKSSTPSFKQMSLSRAKLPIWGYKKDILDTLAAHQAVIICSETGSGKSTQIPSFILENELLSGRSCKVYVAEPRRISAISLARRVSEELGERKSDIGTSSSLVGYAIRLESKVSSSTRLVFATTGVVVRMLERPKDFQDITHLVLDEVHERTIDGDFLLIVVRRLLHERPNLKLILMSATVDSKRLSTYLDNAPVLNIPGRTFPVEVNYLEDAVELTNYRIDDGQLPADYDSDDDKSADEDTAEKEGPNLNNYSKRTRDTITAFNEYHLDYRLITNLVEKIATTPGLDEYSKAILIFMPGLAEIRRLNDEISSLPTFARNWEIFALHSSIASDEQERAFLVPPEGVRKIVIATNIAETGITIPDITAVIDTGKEKVMRFDERRQLSKLVESFISRANAKQRRGRAGRVQRGLCFHLFTKYRHDKLLAEQQTPEMLRLSLQDLVLRVKICNLGEVEQTLSEAPDPPSSKNIRRAIDALKEVKALTSLESLTSLGRQLAKLPLDVFLGKLIIYGTFFKCLDAAVSIAAILSSKSPFVNTMGSNTQRDLARMSFKKGDSDLLTVYNAYATWRRVRTTPGINEYTFCRKNFLSPQGLINIEDIKTQLLVSIADAGLLRLDSAEKASLNRARFTGRQRQFFEVPERTNINGNNDLIMNSVIAWSFYPKLLVREGKGWRNVANNQAVSLHPTSVNKRPDQPLKWLSFYHIMQARSKYYNAHETSAVEDLAVALLCGDVEFKLYSGVIIIDGNRVRFSVNDWKSMLALKVLSNKLRDILSSTFKNPHKPLSPQQEEWMDIWQQIFSQSAGSGA